MVMKIFLCCLIFLIGLSAWSQDKLSTTEWNAAEVTAVIYNSDFPGSSDLANYYAQKRGIPAERMLGLPLSKDETISRADYEKTLRDPVKAWLEDKTIRILTLMRGVPLRISRVKPDAPPAKGDEASTDSELAAMLLPNSTLEGVVKNPYFGSRLRFHEESKAVQTFLVGRLDAASDQTVKRMIDDAVATEANGLVGRAVIDLALKKDGYQQGEDWLKDCTSLFGFHGIASYVNREEALIPQHFPLPDTALYFGWYVGDVTGPFKDPAFKFLPGAVVCHLHSFSAESLRNTERTWAAPLLERGAAATFGNVWEPYLTFTVHFNVLCHRLLGGYTLAEAASAATPGLSWMTTVLGDPLYRPFANRSLPDESMRDYALLSGLATQHKGTDFFRQGVKLAEKRNSPRLLELLGLLAGAAGGLEDASNLLQHSRSLYTDKQDQLRTLIYEIDLLKPTQAARVSELITKTLADPAYKDLPALKVLSPAPSE
jgi:uncharacterized protein (TIGR03790 family)